MGKNRDKLSILASVLEAANSGSSKTGIMLKANLSFKLLEKYMAKAFDAGFLSESGTKFAVTEEGKGFLIRYRQFADRHDNAQKMVDRLSVEREQLSRLYEGSVISRENHLHFTKEERLIGS